MKGLREHFKAIKLRLSCNLDARSKLLNSNKSSLGQPGRLIHSLLPPVLQGKILDSKSCKNCITKWCQSYFDKTYSLAWQAVMRIPY